MASSPTTMLGAAGVPRRPGTRASRRANGSRPSRAMENITREGEAWMASAADRMAMATSASSSVPRPEPRRLELT
jgi:hypothetical protein